MIADKPAAAQIQEMRSSPLPCHRDESGFRIIQSHADQARRAVVTVDLAICQDCLRELNDPSDQRFAYGLINCTNCGPRFSIVQRMPYDRVNTTMSSFALCEKCHQQYLNPDDRRFHAQPVACPACGPRVSLLSVASGVCESGHPIEQAAALLIAGKIVAIKGIGGFHLAVRADDPAAVQLLRTRKNRDAKPFAIMCASVDVARGLVDLSGPALAQLTSPAAPIILARVRAGARSAIAPEIAPGTDRLGVMLPYTPIHHLLFTSLLQRSAITTLVMTSANLTDEPLVKDNDEACRRLAHLADAILWHDRDIERSIDDSILLDLAPDQAPLPIRRARGYVPQVISIVRPSRQPSAFSGHGLCLGGELKSTVAVVRDDEVILGQHLGDLKHALGFECFRKSVTDLCQLFELKPTWIAHDLHPAYLSTQYAAELAGRLGVPLVAVQHHHAHAAAVLGEHHVTTAALAIVCDGVGYGADGSIWGGELLHVDPGSEHEFRRLGHLRPIPLPGGDAAARDGHRCAAGLLWSAIHGDAKTSSQDCESFHQQLRTLVPDRFERDMLTGMLQSNAGCVASSAAGRVFDAVAALLGICLHNDFEAQAPMAMEAAASGIAARQHVDPQCMVVREGNSLIVDVSGLVVRLTQLLAAGDSPAQLVADFHEAFAQAWAAAVRQAVADTGLRTVGLSGGVFCNALLTGRLSELLQNQGLTVLRHEIVPPNDGGIAFGQAVVATQRLARTSVQR